MTTSIVLRVGKRIAPLVTTVFSTLSYELRKEFVQEFEEIPPLLICVEDKNLPSLGYQIEMESWGYVYYEMDEWTFRSENQGEIVKKVSFYLQRFLRKWQMNCCDLLIEKKLVQEPFVLEYGEEWVDIIESEEFHYLFNELKTSLKLEKLTPTFWESEYTSKGELIAYVYGHDYFFKQKNIHSPKQVIQEFLTPLLHEQTFYVKNID